MTTLISAPPPQVPPPLPPRRVETPSTAPISGRAGRWRRRVSSEGFVISVLSLGLFLTAGYFLDFRWLVFPNDAMSRMANGFYVLYSRDPHLASVGFVWNPLTSGLDDLSLLFRGLWPALATHNFAGTITSACAMSGVVYQLGAAMREWGVARAPRLVLLGLFALDPMIVYYGANGMSEAVYMFTLVGASRYLLRWFRADDDSRSLVYAASFIGLAYLARNEAVGAAAVAAMLVAGISFFRSTGRGKRRIMKTLTDTTIFVAPFAVTFIGWATASFVITGSGFLQFAANANQVKASGLTPPNLSARLLHEVHAMTAMAPLLPVVAVIALGLALVRRDPQVLAPIAVIGGGLVFDLLSYLNGQLYPWFRYYILAVPLEVLLLASAVGTVRVKPAERQVALRPARWRAVIVGLASAVAVGVLLAPSLPATAKGMFNQKLAPDSNEELGFVFHRHLNATDVGSKNSYAHIASIASYLASMHLPSGDVLVDNNQNCVPQLIVMSPDPKIFVIPNDRDFQATLHDPLTFHTHYLLIPNGGIFSDAISMLYPGIYNNGASIAREVHEFKPGGPCVSYRLYKVTAHTAV